MMERRGFLLSLAATAVLPKIPVADVALSPEPVPALDAISVLQQPLEKLVTEAFRGWRLGFAGIEISIQDLLGDDFVLPAFLSACAEAEPGCVVFATEPDDRAFMSKRATLARVSDWSAMRVAVTKVATEIEAQSARRPEKMLSWLDLTYAGGPLDRSWESHTGQSMHDADVDVKLAFHPEAPVRPAAQATVTSDRGGGPVFDAARYAKAASALWEAAPVTSPRYALSLARAGTRRPARPGPPSRRRTSPPTRRREAGRYAGAVPRRTCVPGRARPCAGR